jgi:phosphoglycerate dehydrogenase-like enzyme
VTETQAETVLINNSGYKFPSAVLDWPGVRLIEMTADADVPAELAGDVVITTTEGSKNLEEILSRGIGWVHTIGTGVDNFPFDVLDGQTLTCSRGASGLPIGEWVFAQMRAFAKAMPEVFVSDEPETWGIDGRIGSLRGATVVVVGVGGIGTEVARLSLALDMTVIGVRRSGNRAPFDEMSVVNDLGEVIGEADHLVLAAPATAETLHLIDSAILEQVKPGLHLVNIARGALIDQDALRVALDDGRVARASLDVTDPEPLPAGHWLYEHPRVRLTPHTSWMGPGALGAMMALLRTNYDLYRAGQPLEGIVDVEVGY